MKETKGEVSVYIEGLLVQVRDVDEVCDWASKNMKDETQSLSDEIKTSYEAWDRKRPWAHHFNSMDGYIIVKNSIIYDDPKKANTCVVNVTLNQTNNDAPTLSVVSELKMCDVLDEQISAMAALARYYMADGILLGDDSGQH